MRLENCIKMKVNQIKHNANCSYCLRCKNYIDGSLKVDYSSVFPITTISCNNPRHKEILKNVIIYRGSSCLDYQQVKIEGL